MNAHVATPSTFRSAAVAAAGALATSLASSPRDDRELIELCLRAKKLFVRERAAEQRLFDAIDRRASETRLRAAASKAVEALKASVAEIASIQARTPEGLAYKAALLEPWVAAGMTLYDEDGPGQELALSIALDARVIGMRDVRYATSQRRP